MLHVHFVPEVSGQAECDPHRQASDRNMREMVGREWARHEAVIMEKVRGIILELFSQSGGEL